MRSPAFVPQDAMTCCSNTAHPNEIYLLIPTGKLLNGMISTVQKIKIVG